MKKKKIIAIDGPAAAGKSTVARLLAEETGYLYLETGVMYRALALKILRLGINISNENEIVRIASFADLKMELEKGNQKIILDGENITEAVRVPALSQPTSVIAQYSGVRESVQRKQREIAETDNIVVEGRDTTTVVFPSADVKIFLKASLEERITRRLHDIQNAGVEADADAVKKEVEERDRRDMGREVAPLKQADDAIVVDSTGKSIEETVKEILTIVKKRLKDVRLEF